MTTSSPILNSEANSPDKEPNTLSLVSAEASKITNVSLYSGRAEITRLFKLALTEGQNQITIRGFPQSLQNDSVRVEGRGNASIHDVVISQPPFSINAQIESAGRMHMPQRKHQELKNQIASVKHARSALDAYLGTFNAENVAISELGDRFASHALLAHKLDNDILDLEQELAELTENFRVQWQKSTLLTAEAIHLPWQIAIDGRRKQMKTRLRFGSYTRSTMPTGRRAMISGQITQSSGKNVTIHYKASIRQDTGEPWVGVPLTLETVTPAFEMVSPSLSPWILAAKVKPEYIVPRPTFHSPAISMPAAPGVPFMPSTSRSAVPSPQARMPAMQHRPVFVATDKGDVTATFRIPGLINVPSDAQQHNITISSFEFRAPLLWRTIPKASAHVYMEAKIKNESEYSFIAGPANLYVDGSFVATTSIPAVSPQETFNCPLGLDSSLRVTYHRQEVNNSMTGFYKKSTTKTYTQRIAIVNTKSTPIENLKVVDIIPVSQDERIEIKLMNPLLPFPVAEPSGLQRTMSLASTDKDSTSKEKKSDRIRVSPGVMALWDGSGDPETNQDVVGKTGRVRWDVSLRPQETVNLVLKFEVSYPDVEFWPISTSLDDRKASLVRVYRVHHGPNA